jgi:hypothetical protein
MSCPRFVFLGFALGALVALGCEEDQPTAPTPRYSESAADTFSVGDSVSLRIEDFAGGVTIHPGAADTVRVDYTKWASRISDLAQIQVAMNQVDDDVTVVASNPTGLTRASVDFEATVPSGSELVIHAGAGNIKSLIRLAGECEFTLGPGNILLQLPSDMGAIVHLSTAVGSVSVDFSVSGTVTSTSVNGTIGAGDEAEIWAAVAVGNIRVSVGN